jgi:flavin-dependent dehydrogenase
MDRHHAMTCYDVVVAGAGPSGSATARRLAQQGCRVALVERSCFGTPRIGESLSPGVQPRLRALGVWDDFMALGALPSWGVRSVWGDAAAATHSHLHNAYGCGWHVDRCAFDRMLAQSAVNAGAELLQGTAVQQIEAVRDGWAVHLVPSRATPAARVPRTVRTRLWIDATGRNARLARGVGASRVQFDQLVGIAAEVHHAEGASRGHLRIEAAEAGWWYFAPLPSTPGCTGPGEDDADGACAWPCIAMLMTDADLCQRGHLNRAPGWQALFDATDAGRDGCVVRGAAPELGVHCAGSQRLHRNDAARPGQWLAVGDAALAVDPVSGSGVVRALDGGSAAAETAMRMLDGQGPEAVMAYEHARDLECDRYLHDRAAYYAAETRWPRSAFWQRRRLALAA